MQRFTRQDWLWLIGSLVVAGVLVALIPRYGLVGGHAEHAAMPEVPGTTHQVVPVADGVAMQMEPVQPDSGIQMQIHDHMEDEAARYRAGTYTDAMGMVTAATAAALQAHSAQITVTVDHTPARSTIRLTSPDPATRALLTQWAAEMSAMHP